MCTFENSSVALKAMAEPVTKILTEFEPDCYKISFDAVAKRIVVTYDAGHAEDLDVVIIPVSVPETRYRQVKKFSLRCREHNELIYVQNFGCLCDNIVTHETSVTDSRVVAMARLICLNINYHLTI